MILITGSTGLVGSHLLNDFLRKDKKVRALVRPSSERGLIKKVLQYYNDDFESLYNNIEWAEGDLLDRLSLFEAMEGIDEVYHTAAFVSFSKKDKYKVLEYNIEGTASLVNVALEKDAKKFCFVSSSSALGPENEDGIKDEKCIWKSSKGHSVYAISKFKSEMEVWRGITEGLNAVIVNPTIILGPGNWKRSSPRMFNEIWNGLKFYTHGITGYVDVHDVVGCITGLMEKEMFGERYIINEGNYSFKEIFDKMALALGRKKPSIHAGPFMTKMAYLADNFISNITGKEPVITKETTEAGKGKKYFSNEKIKRALGYEFKSIDRSIEETAKLFLKEKGL